MGRLRPMCLCGAGLGVITAVCLMTLTGCRQKEPLAVKQTETSHLMLQPTLKKLPTLLVSELDLQSGEPVIPCPLKFRNTSHKKRILEFGGAGCSCYGVFVDDHKLESGERLEVAPDEEVEFVIRSSVPAVEISKDLQAFFLEQDGQSWPRIPLQCTVKILNDVRVEPVLLSIVLKPEQNTATGSVTVIQTHRGPFTDDTPPQLEGLPEEVTTTSIETATPPTEIESGIWKREWKINLQCTLHEASDVDAAEKRVTVSFPGPGDPPRYAQTFQFQIRRDLPIRYPREVQFGKLALGEQRSRRLFISSVDREFELQVSPHSTHDDQLKVSVLDPQGARKHYVEITVTPAKAGTFQDEIQLATNLPELPVLTLQVRALVPESETSTDSSSVSQPDESQ